MKTATKKPKGKPSPLATAPLAAMLRVAYQAEIERLATTLRPRFESGELRGYTDSEDFNHFELLENICAQHFGLKVTKHVHKGHASFTADDTAAHLVLASSPLADLVWDSGVFHVAYLAQTAAAWDLLLLARARGWSRPLPDEAGLESLTLDT